MPSRFLSRRRALQVLYECDLRKVDPAEAVRDYYGTLYSEENESRPDVDEFMEALVVGTYSVREEIDELIGRFAEHWKVERMAMVDRNVLRLAIFEIKYNRTPAAIVIDQAIELARKFSGDEAARFINGVLDAFWKSESATAAAP